MVEMGVPLRGRRATEDMKEGEFHVYTWQRLVFDFTRGAISVDAVIDARMWPSCAQPIIVSR